MKLSVIIPCYNAAEVIAPQLESLANQNWSEPWEVIVSDNGSTDNSLKLVDQFSEELPGLRVVDSSDIRGAAHARNLGAQVARAKALAFTDADDVVAPGWVAAMGRALSKYDFVAGRLEPLKLNNVWEKSSRKVPQTNGLQEYVYPPYLPHAASCNLGIKRTLHQAVGGFDESLPRLMDTDYCWRIQLAGTKLHFVPDAVVRLRLRNTPGAIFKQARLWGKYNVFLYKKYRPLGMPKLPWYSGVKAWVKLLRTLPIHRRENLPKWVWSFSWRLGRLQGCIRYGVLAL